MATHLEHHLLRGLIERDADSVPLIPLPGVERPHLRGPGPQRNAHGGGRSTTHVAAGGAGFPHVPCPEPSVSICTRPHDAAGIRHRMARSPNRPAPPPATPRPTLTPSAASSLLAAGACVQRHQGRPCTTHEPSIGRVRSHPGPSLRGGCYTAWGVQAPPTTRNSTTGTCSSHSAGGPPLGSHPHADLDHIVWRAVAAACSCASAALGRAHLNECHLLPLGGMALLVKMGRGGARRSGGPPPLSAAAAQAAGLLRARLHATGDHQGLWRCGWAPRDV